LPILEMAIATGPPKAAGLIISSQIQITNTIRSWIITQSRENTKLADGRA
jgi:hypothetical protein